jgi:DHA1 family multidrug resistance protein-like MFS transporter
MRELIAALRNRRSDPVSQLMLTQLVMFTGIAAMFPVAPLYVRSHGGTALDVAIFIAGPMITNTLVQIPAGHAADRWGRKPIMVGSRALYAILCLGLFVNLGPLWFLTLLRAGQGIAGGAYLPALRATIADLTPEDQRGRSYGKLQAVQMVGLLVGPFLGGLIALWSYSGIFLCAGLGMAVGGFTLLRLPESGRRAHAGDEAEFGSLPAFWWIRRRAILVASQGLLAMGMLFALYDTIWPQYLSNRHAGTVVIGISISLFAVPVILLAGTAGGMADNRSRRLLAVVAFATVGACAVSYPELHMIPVIVAVGLIEAVGVTLLQPTLFAVLGEAAPAHAQGRAMGVGGLFEFGGGAVGASVLGSLYGVSLSLPFFIGGAVCGITAITCGLVLPERSSAFGRPDPPEVVDLDLGGVAV